jgi:hypothetical protein
MWWLGKQNPEMLVLEREKRKKQVLEHTIINLVITRQLTRQGESKRPDILQVKIVCKATAFSQADRTAGGFTVSRALCNVLSAVCIGLHEFFLCFFKCYPTPSNREFIKVYGG